LIFSTRIQLLGEYTSRPNRLKIFAQFAQPYVHLLRKMPASRRAYITAGLIGALGQKTQVIYEDADTSSYDRAVRRVLLQRFGMYVLISCLSLLLLTPLLSK